MSQIVDGITFYGDILVNFFCSFSRWGPPPAKASKDQKKPRALICSLKEML
jgi:hypothetical protein